MEENKINLNESLGIIFGLIALSGAIYVGGKYVSSSNYKQKMIPNDKGYFNPEMFVGEKFTITYFTGNEEPNELMDLYALEKKTGWKSYKDEYGTYLKVVGSSDNESTDMRVYLPKKEWFAEFKGKIRMISDSEGDGSLKHNNYGLCFYLKNPKNAIKTKIVRSDGTTFFGPPQNIYDPVNKTYSDDPSRGWAILDTFKQSGYFSLSPDVISQDVVESHDYRNSIEEQYDFMGNSNVMQFDPTGLKQELASKALMDEKKNEISKKIEDISINPPSGLQEYQWSAYSEKYGRTEFDRWYDSSNGMWIVIGTQICMAIATGGISTWATAAVESTTLVIARNLVIQIGGELIAGGWEAVYLYNRGLNSQAALVAFCCFLPILTESAFFGRVIGKPPGFDDSIAKLTREFRAGGMRSPADFKKWFKALDPEIQTMIKQRMEVIAPYYLERGTSAVSQKIRTAMNNAIAEIKRGSDLKIGSDLDLLKNWDFVNNPKLLKNPKIQKYIRGLNDLDQVAKEAQEIGTFIRKKGSFWKGLGLSVLAVGSLFPICMFAFKDNEEFKKDPQKILTGAENEILSFRIKSVNNAAIFEKKINILLKEIESAANKGDYNLAFDKTKVFTQIMVDLDNITKEGWMTKRKYHNFIEQFRSSALLELQTNFYNGVSENNKKKAIEAIDNFKDLTDEEDMNKVYDSFFMCPSSYKKVQEGYTDEKGVLFKVDNNTLLLFINWFIGYKAIENIWSVGEVPFMSSKGLSITTTFYFINRETGLTQKRDNTCDYSSLVKEFKGNFENVLRYKYNYTDQSVINYWGNMFIIRKIFTDYYDDYLLSSKTITTTTTNKQ